MRTTTIGLPEELKARVVQAAKAVGTTSHSFILEAIAENVDLAERYADSYTQTDQRWAEFLENGESIPWEGVRRYLTDRIHGRAGPRPVARKFAR